MKIMVTGAAGNYGSLAIDYIKQFAPDTELYGLIHDPSKASALEAKGVNVRVADYADKSSLVKAFEGIDRLLFVSVPVTDLQKMLSLPSVKAISLMWLIQALQGSRQTSLACRSITHRPRI